MRSLIQVSRARQRGTSDRAAQRERSDVCCTAAKRLRSKCSSVARPALRDFLCLRFDHATRHPARHPFRLRAGREVNAPRTASLQSDAVLSGAALQNLISRLRECSTYESKVELLLAAAESEVFLAKHGEWFSGLAQDLQIEEVFVLLCLVVMGQDHVLVRDQSPSAIYASLEQCRTLAANLLKLETFYDSLGGLLGYQQKSLQLIAKKSDSESDKGVSIEYLMPPFLDLSQESDEARAAVRAGIESIPVMCELYALGGSGDRLGLQCPESGELLPSAMLPYCGRSMLDSMIRDLQARESLHYKLTGDQYTTPVAIMTSDAKDNDVRIKGMLRAQNWYGRGREAFYVFKQPMVPLLEIESGAWLAAAPGKIEMRPGGHGVIWKLMWDEGVFDWLKERGCKAAIVRQVSNPMAATDTTPFGLFGLGVSQMKDMGFASCERVVGAAEGMNVVQHRCSKQPGTLGSPVYESALCCIGKDAAHAYGITNIEYTEFERLGLTDVAVGHDSMTSCFPANTNILFVSLDAAQMAVRESVRLGGFGACLPGLIFNTKKRVSHQDELTGEQTECLAGRMECMMQNLADSLADYMSLELRPETLTVEALSTFMVSNVRRKVTSSAKKKYSPGGSIRQTPEGSFWDLLLNARDILQQCGMRLPEMGTVEEYLRRGPDFIFLFHPALGPLWSLITHKIVGGRIARGSELVLEIAEAQISNLDLDGSLIVKAENIIGHLSQVPRHSAAETDGHGGGSDAMLQYSSRVGRIQLENVKIQNAGIDWKHHANVYWKHEICRVEFCTVQLQGCSEFSAKDITISGQHVFHVPDGHRLCLTPDPCSPDGFREELSELPSGQPSWEWEYRMERGNIAAMPLVT